ncbi:hypothetical protein [Cellulosimicrobium cellulans]|uniref:hypothetical protein n=1 Tax=Cellulosimicrobium cellulans TaxID=1710 RepID=UPI0008484C0A|nr:hypothetical protein [Cellulosimicrobium cellulans]
MSETNVPYGTGTGSPTSPASGGSGQQGSGVKDRLGEAASSAGDAGREVAGEAKDKARDVAHEAKDRARGLVDQGRSQLQSQAQSQQQRLAGGLRTLGDELNQMASGSQDPGYASELVQRAGDATTRVADWFEDREPSSVLREVEDFARRRPGMFIAIAAGAGLVVGRLLRGMKDADGGSGSGGQHAQVAGGASQGGGGYSTAGYLGAADTGYGSAGYSGTGSTGTGPYGTTAAGAPTSGATAGTEPGYSGGSAYPDLANQPPPPPADTTLPRAASGETGSPAFPPSMPARPASSGGDTDVDRT